jgi:high-affinity nickel-transport protein
MSTEAIFSITGALVMLGLGVRHALDPDHVATVDGIAFGLLSQAPRLAPWVGALFALGHGLVITAIAMAVSAAAMRVALPPQLLGVVEWSPAVLLVLVGVLNIRALRSQADAYAPVGWKSGLLPKGMRNGGASPFTIFLVGMAFALAVDTAVQAAAWGAAAATQGGVMAAATLCLAFTAGMVVAAGAYGQLIVKVLQAASASAQASRYRRMIGWGTVVFAFGVALYMVAAHFVPALEQLEESLVLAGLASVVVLVAGLGLARLRKPCATAPVAPEPTVLAAPSCPRSFRGMLVAKGLVR